MVVSCDRPPRYKKMSLLWRQFVSVLVDSSSFIMSWMVGEWWGATSLAENTLSRCPYRPSSGRTRSFHRGLGPSSELLLSEDNQHCFKQALNSEEKGATDLQPGWWNQCGFATRAACRRDVTGLFCFWSHGSAKHVRNDKRNSSMQLTQQLFLQRLSAAQVVSAMNRCSADILKKTSEIHPQSLVRSLRRADRPVHRANILLMLLQHALPRYHSFCSSVCLWERRWAHFLKSDSMSIPYNIK